MAVSVRPGGPHRAVSSGPGLLTWRWPWQPGERARDDLAIARKTCCRSQHGHEHDHMLPSAPIPQKTCSRSQPDHDPDRVPPSACRPRQQRHARAERDHGGWRHLSMPRRSGVGGHFARPLPRMQNTSPPFPGWDLGAVLDEVGDDDRRREEEQAEDEVPDEAVALPASDPGGPERDRNPDDSKQNPPETDMAASSPRSHETLIPAAGWQFRHQRRCRTLPLCAPPRNHPRKGDLRRS